MTLPGTVVIKSTADLTPDGLAGYVKFLSGVAQFLGAALAVVVPYLNPDSKWAIYVGGAIAVLGLLGTFQFPNAVKPVIVPPPAINVEPSADSVVPPAPAPIPDAVLEEPPVADPDPVLGVIDPPGRHEQP